MAGLAPILTLASTAFGVIGQIQQANAAKAAAEAQALQEEQRAKTERAVASVKADRAQKDAERLISTQRARFAASGGDIASGSASDVISNTSGRGLYNSEIELWLGEERAKGNEFQATIDRQQAKAQSAALPFKIGTALLSGFSGAIKSNAFAPADSSSSSSFFYG